MPRFSAHLAWLFTDRPFIERFRAAAAAGFQAVEVRFPYDHAPTQVKAELEKHRLTMLGLNTAPGNAADGAFGTAALPGCEAEFADAFRQALDYAVAIGSRQIHCLSGRIRPDQRSAAEATLIRNLARAADLAGEKDIILLIEPINSRDQPNYFLNRIEQAADIIVKVGRSNLLIQFDFYHAQIEGGDLLRRFQEFFPIIGHAQVASVPSRHEPDEGEVNYPAIFDVLDRLGYQGWIGAEYRPRGTTEEGLAWARPYGVQPCAT